jgi:two-component system, sensor histidine kinase LadS
MMLNVCYVPLVKRLLMLMFLLVFAVTNVWSYNIYLLNSSSSEETIKLAHRPDSAFNLLLEDVQYYNFKKQKVDVINLAYTSIPHWFAFSYYNEDEADNFYLAIENSMLDSVDVYFVQGGELLKFHKGGDFLPYYSREFDNPDFIIKMPYRKGVVIDVFIRIRSEVNLLAPVKIYSESRLLSKINNISVGLGIYYGALAVIFFYSLFLYFRLKDRSYLYYVTFLAAYGLSLFNFDGYFFKFISPSYPYFNNLILYVFIYSATIFGTLFTISYLDLKKNWKFGYYLILATVSPMVVATFLVFVFPDIMMHDMIASGISAVVSFIGIISGIVVWRKGVVTAQYYVIAYTFMLSSVIVFVLKDLGVLSSNDFTEYVMHFGSSLEMILLSLGLADRYNRLQKDNARAQKRIIQSLEEVQRVQEKANAELEQKVIERTEEINHQKELIEEKSKEIIDSINYAKRIQSAILPPKYVFSHYLPQSFILYLPKDIVAGDFYWMETKVVADHPMILFASADCTGHGVPGAMVSVICNNALNRSVREFALHRPGEILDKTREIIVKEFEKSAEDMKDGMDISLCCLDLNPFIEKGKEKRKLSWSGANNPLWIVSPSLGGDYLLKEIKPDKMPIGKYASQAAFTTHELEISEGDTVYLFTDGFADQFGGPKGKKFMCKQLKELILSIQSLTLPEQHRILQETFQNWRGQNEQIDDICIIGVRI